MTKFIESLLLFIFLNFQTLLHSVQNNSVDLLQLNSVLNSLATKSGTSTSQIGLMGEFLIGKQFKDIFSEEQRQSVTPKIDKNALVLLKFGRNQNVYQLKLLQQNYFCLSIDLNLYDKSMGPHIN